MHFGLKIYPALADDYQTIPLLNLNEEFHGTDCHA